MEIQTRRQILEIWRATVDYCYKGGEWTWGGRSGRNSISDAEQLLTLLYPATVIPSLRIDSIDQRRNDKRVKIRDIKVRGRDMSR